MSNNSKIRRNNLLVTAFRNTFSRNIKNFLFGSLGSTLSIFTVWVTFFRLPHLCSVIMGFGLIVVLFLLRWFYYISKGIIRYIHNTYVDSIWGKAIVDLKDAYAMVHCLRKKTEITDEEFLTTLVSFCNILKKIFDRKTKGDCCVSIKVPVGRFETIEAWNLENLCRDESHRQRDTQEYERTKHTVIGNTPYTVICNNLLSSKSNPVPYYINNDIENTKDYMNTSRNLHQESQRYKSELVYAIVPIMGEHEYRHELLGFLCIDCNKKNAFDTSRYDVPMVEGIVDGIYDIILNRTTPK